MCRIFFPPFHPLNKSLCFGFVFLNSVAHRFVIPIMVFKLSTEFYKFSIFFCYLVLLNHIWVSCPSKLPIYPLQRIALSITKRTKKNSKTFIHQYLRIHEILSGLNTMEIMMTIIRN